MRRVRAGIALEIGEFGETGPDTVARRTALCVALARQAENCGFDSVWVGESYGKPPRFHLPNPLLALATIGGSTRLTLGTGAVLLPAWEVHRLATDVAVLDQISGGRVVLGVGAGPVGLRERLRPDRKIAVAELLDETIQALRTLWRGEPWTDEPRGHRYDRLPVLPEQQDGPKVLVGGGVAASARRAAQLGDGFFASSTQEMHHIERLVGIYQAELAARGETCSRTGSVTINRLTLLAETTDDAYRDASRYVLPVLRRYGQMRTLRVPDGVGALPADLGPEVLDRFCLVGTPADVRRTLAGYQRSGVDAVNFRVAPGGMPREVAERTIQLLGDGVLGRMSAHRGSEA